MNLFIPISMVAFIASTMTGCAGDVVNIADALAAGDTCRTLVDAKGKQVLCGNEAEWAEFDRHAALINAGVTCRFARTPQELCLTEAQWVVHARRMQGYGDAQGMGAEQTNDAAQIGAASYQAAQFQVQFDASPYQMQMRSPAQ